MRIFKTKWFTRYAHKTKIDDTSLYKVIERAESGIIDADLGCNLIKLRIPRIGQGKSGGYRTIVAYKRHNIAIFLFGYAKNERENIEDDELESLKEIANAWLKCKEQEINRSLENGTLKELIYEKKT